MIDSHHLYQSERESLLVQVRGLTNAQVNTPVASCPGWTVKDVVAHLSGLVAETLADVPLPRGSDEATARQVRDRARWSLSAICDEWAANAGAFEAFAKRDPDYVAALASDLVVHAHDIAEAVGLPIDEASAQVRWVAARYLGVLQARSNERLGQSVNVVFSGTKPMSADGEPPQELTLTTTPFIFLRSVTGRRSRSQVEALLWSADPTALLDDAWDQYGSMAD